MTKEMIELKYETWGSYGQFTKTMAVLRNGQLVDPEALARNLSSGDVVEMNIGGVKVLVTDQSSSKNYRIYVQVPASKVMAVISESKSSRKWSGFKVEGEGEVVGEVMENLVEAGNKRITKRVKTYYYVNGDLKIPLRSEYLGVETQLIGKPRVAIKRQDGKVLVTGDTYQIRDQLKALKFRWDPLSRAWYIPELDEATMQKLSEVADVAE
jgi:hypothetical protein